MPKQEKIAIIGLGNVGGAIAYASLIQGIARHVALYDIDEPRVLAQAADLSHGLAFCPRATVEASADLSVCKDAHVVVITAGAKQKPGQSRLDLLHANVLIFQSLIPKLMAAAPNAVLLIVSNPVDLLTHLALKITGWGRERVIGSGTVLDSARFRQLIAERLHVSTANVHAYIAGEHGDSEIPLWGCATVGGVPVSQWAVMGHGKLSVRDRVEIFQGVKTAAQFIIAGKGATDYAIGLSTAQILRAILRDEQRVLPVSTRIDKLHGIEDVCLSLPTIVGSGGAGPVLDVPMTDAEKAGLLNSADVLKKARTW